MWTVTGLFDAQSLPEKLLTPNEGGTLRTPSPTPPSMLTLMPNGVCRR